MRLSYDLHIHSCLSPCGDADMTPNNIVHMALLAGFDMIALTDHNTCGKLSRFVDGGKGSGADRGAGDGALHGGGGPCGLPVPGTGGSHGF